MKELPDCQFYCLSFNNEERKNTMIRRFNNFDVDCKFYDGVRHDDKRIINKNLSECLMREWSCCYGHLDMIYNFYYKTNKKYGIFCEDDIHIHKDLIEIMPKILLDFNILNLDILLLGYLTPFKVNEMIDIGYSLKRKTNIKPIYSYHNYPDKLTGTHMYILSRKHAKVLLDKYYENYADNNKTIFISDIVITKEGNRALISPVLAVEENQSYKKNDLHNSCHKAHFKSDKFI